MSEPELFPVEIIYHHNRYGSYLLDVDGYPLVGESGHRLNVFREEMKDMMIARKIRFMHYLKTEPTYAYFVTSNEQLGRFHIERFEGSLTPNKRYHVYADY
jgi:hypothetical protein